MKTGQSVYLRLGQRALPDRPCKEGHLHRAVVVGSTDDHWTVALEEPDLEIMSELPLVIFYTLPLGFVQQPAEIVETDESASASVLTLRTVGDPVSAEQRGELRLSTAGVEISAEVGREPNCRLQDVSLAGFAIATTEDYAIGQVLSIQLSFGGSTYMGRATIQNCSALWAHRKRYGLRSVDGRTEGENLREGLALVSTEIQRMQLRRLRKPL